MKKTIAVIASLDTKGAEVSFVKEMIERLSCRTLIIDVSVWGESALTPDVPRDDVLRAGGRDWTTIQHSPKHERIVAMVEGAAMLVPDLYRRGAFDAILSIGGMQNTTMGVAGMKALPLGVPKLMVSTVASGARTFEPLVGSKDILLMPSVADVAGINVLTRTILGNAAAAIVGMATHAGQPLRVGDEMIIGLTQIGVTNGVVQATRILEQAGYQVIGFHATGVGGRAMEELIAAGTIKAVMDLTLHEIVAEMFGRGYSVGANHRLETACKAGIPQVLAPGGVDFIDFAVRDLPADMDKRKYIFHNADCVHVKLLKDEIVRAGSIIVERVNRNNAPVTVVLPLRGFRQATAPGEPMWDPEVDNALIETLRTGLKPGIKVVEIDANINDTTFSEAAAGAMLELLAGRKTR
jgi:uncharacterized protein (UPF0261 family)